MSRHERATLSCLFNDKSNDLFNVDKSNDSLFNDFISGRLSLFNTIFNESSGLLL